MRKWLIASITAFGLAVLCTGAMFLFTSHMVANEREWAEANVRPSAVQEFAVALARWCRNYWYVGGSVIALMVFGLAVFVMVGTTRSRKRNDGEIADDNYLPAVRDGSFTARKPR